MSTTAAAMTRSVAAAEDIATPLATIAAVVRGIGFRKLQMIHARAGVTRITAGSFGFSNLMKRS